VPAADTEKVAVCPAVTDWLAGWDVSEGAVVTEPVVLDASPEQPVERIPSSITTKTKLKRFIQCLFQRKFPGHSYVIGKKQELVGDQLLQPAHACRDTRLGAE
jgi:hypothetical protein